MMTYYDKQAEIARLKPALTAAHTHTHAHAHAHTHTLYTNIQTMNT